MFQARYFIAATIPSWSSWYGQQIGDVVWSELSRSRFRRCDQASKKVDVVLTIVNPAWGHVVFAGAAIIHALE